MKEMLIGYDCPHCKTIHLCKGMWTTEAEMDFREFGKRAFKDEFEAELEDQLSRSFKKSHEDWMLFDPKKVILDQERLQLVKLIYETCAGTPK